MAIELQDITKVYDDGDQPVLSHVNMSVNDGEFFVIVGPSGCGKSTLLRMIAGLISISSGKLFINGTQANDLPPKDRKLSMVFQSYALFPFMNVYDNVAFGLKARKMSEKEVKDRVDHALDMVNLTKFAKRKPRALSGGQRQRVALARAIASDAKVCLMDEPLSNLDAQLRARMRLELRDLQKKLGLTVIYVTHDQVEAMTMADRVMVLHDHKVQQLDTPINIYKNPKNEFVAQFFGTPQINLLSANFSNREFKINNSFSLPVRRQFDDGQYTIGIRPNEFNVEVTQKGSNARTREVSYLGDKTVATAEILDGGQIVRLVLNNQVDIAEDNLIKITGAKQFYVFDSKTGEVLFNEREANLNATITAE